MIDDFLVRAVLGGSVVALVAGPFGAFVVWRRMAFFGDTLAHAALLGVAAGLLIGADVQIGILTAVVLAALLLARSRRGGVVSDDAFLGILSHSALALGLVALGFLRGVAVDLQAYLFGDILAISRAELWWILGGGGAALGALGLLWRPLLAETVSADIAHVEGVNIDRVRGLFLLLLALVVGVAIKLVGVLLITALLVVPASAARVLSRSPEQMAVIAGVIGVASVAAGLAASWHWDTPAGPSIVVAAAVIFLLSCLRR